MSPSRHGYFDTETDVHIIVINCYPIVTDQTLKSIMLAIYREFGGFVRRKSGDGVQNDSAQMIGLTAEVAGSPGRAGWSGNRAVCKEPLRS